MFLSIRTASLLCDDGGHGPAGVDAPEGGQPCWRPRRLLAGTGSVPPQWRAGRDKVGVHAFLHGGKAVPDQAGPWWTTA
jgi:hypothetical protein